MTPGPAVEVVDLVKAYAGRRVVDDLSFTVATGSVLALLGPNGAGKTTTVETCEGFRTPDAGSVRVLGLDPTADRRAVAPRVGVMLQSGGVYPGASAAEMLRLMAALHAHPLDPAGLIERLGLSAAAGTAYRRLSGGEKQRLSLAMAVVGRPDVVFLDEPTAGLDPQARHATWDLVRALRADGVTVVLTTHAMDEAEQLADEVVIIDAGRVVAAGQPVDLTRSVAAGEVRFRADPGLDRAALAAALPPGATLAEPAPGRFLVAGA
ncbi:MAG TPA: ABC transporter ATP-binding protein, partial [Mycobacteriales bacterium]|nr:ABC transporter ATP-binding protein [Mycobacteriales bacterium]